jgi:hypothetical protein
MGKKIRLNQGFLPAIFQKGLGWQCSASAALNVCIIALEKFFLFWVQMKDWKAKLESVYYFMLKILK